jgi:hypothetical protein
MQSSRTLTRIASLYESKKKYMEKVEQASQAPVQKRFLLKEDIPRVLGRAERQWEWSVK